MKRITVKVSEKLAAELESAARDEGVSRSKMIRKALEDRVARRPLKKPRRTYDLIKKFAGCIKGGPGDLATNPKYMEGFGA